MVRSESGHAMLSIIAVQRTWQRRCGALLCREVQLWAVKWNRRDTATQRTR